MTTWGGRRISRLRTEVVARHGTVCWICGEPITGLVSLDHVVPRSKGGSDDVENLRPAHFGCNSARGNRMRAKRKLVPLNTSRRW